MKHIAFTAFVVLWLVGCSPEVGSDEWCANMKKKPTGEWTQNEIAEFAKNCIFKFGGKDD